MIVDTYLTISYKCNVCGTFDFLPVSLFGLMRNSRTKILCRCKKSSIEIFQKNQRDFIVHVPCIACGRSHMHSFNRKILFKSGTTTYLCPNTLIQQCFIGNDIDVRVKVDSIERELDDIIDRCGYDSYFDNTQVMFDSLNRIHDLAEQGNLLCECGNNEIGLFLYPGSIYLKCAVCPAAITIPAVSNENLKVLLTKNQIILMDELSDFQTNKVKSTRLKRDSIY
jgi:hypothetical protein